jgi:opacity protein-like surface antigen
MSWLNLRNPLAAWRPALAGLRFVAALLFVLGCAGTARAETYLTPFLGYNFGADAGCPQGFGNCEDKKSNWGVTIGSAGTLFGLEEEFAYSKNFFGDTPGVSSSVMTLMTNVIAGPKIVFVRPYVVAGVGLMKTHVELTPASLVTSDTNFGWDVGGGVFLTAAHVGVRGDIRYFHGAQDLSFLGFQLSNLKLDYGRAYAGFVLQW